MSLVGDVIMAVRDVGPDPPQGVLSPPATELTVVAAATPAGSTSFPAGNNYVRLSYLNPWGETLGSSPEATVVVGANQVLSITGTMAPGATSVRLYHGLAVGAENKYITASLLPATLNYADAVPGTIPSQSSAYLPDSDGRFASAATVYRWLNEAFDKSGLSTNGVRDQTGVPMVNGNGAYFLTGRWTKLLNVWFDGWLMSKQGALNFYYHNTAKGISWLVDVTKVTNTGLVVAVWPQANRTGASTTLSAPMTATSTSASVTASTSFLALGLAQIGTEICEYSTTGTGALNGLVRGLGGSTAQAWPIGTAVAELNLRVQGMRLPNKNAPGDAYKTADVPYGIDSILSTYMLHKYREAEQDRQAAAALLKEFYSQLASYAEQNRQVAGPTQIGGVARETYGSGLGGGWFIP